MPPNAPRVNLARLILWLSALWCGGFGAAFALFPQSMARLIDIGLPTDTARVDFVATYGGMELGLSVFLALCAWRKERVRVGLLASGWVLAGLGSTRLVAMLLYSNEARFLYVFALAEALGSVVSFWAARQMRPPPNIASRGSLGWPVRRRK